MDDRAALSRSPTLGRLRSALGFVGRYVGVGLFVSGADYLVFFLALASGVSVLGSNLLSRVASTVVGATLHRVYTFAGPQRLGYRRQLVAYGLLSLFNLGLSSACLYLLVDVMSIEALWAKVATDVIVILISMGVSRILIFAPAR